MADSWLSVRSASAKDLAYRLAQRENCSITEIVERALELYATHQAQLEPAQSFYRRMSAEAGSDIDLETTIRAVRGPHTGPEL